MAWLLLLAVVILPVTEIALFVKAVQSLGLLSTILLALLAAMVGLSLLRRQGLRNLEMMRGGMSGGPAAMAEAFDSICITLAGLLLILPGFLSDVVALALLAPPVRAGLKTWLVARVIVSRPGQTGAPPVIDGEYQVIDADPPPTGPKRP